MENNVMTHLRMFGNTRNIMQLEVHIDTEQGRDNLERIEDMLKYNKQHIKILNEDLRNSNSFYCLFGRQQEGRDLLEILHYQRSRIIRIWNNQLNKLKM